MTDLIGNIGSAQMEQEIEKKVMKIIQKQQKEIEKQVGNFSNEVTENNVRDYIKLVIDERNNLHKQRHKKRFDEDSQSKI
jgi:benzoyl-CoA reductase/2-hydroxyglutaryl-CoA dehydratase subunit BcrC/BadD/HgdB